MACKIVAFADHTDDPAAGLEEASFSSDSFVKMNVECAAVEPVGLGTWAAADGDLSELDPPFLASLLLAVLSLVAAEAEAEVVAAAVLPVALD